MIPQEKYREILIRLDQKMDTVKEVLDGHSTQLDMLVPIIAKHETSIAWLRLGLVLIFGLVGILIPIAYEFVHK